MIHDFFEVQPSIHLLLFRGVVKYFDLDVPNVIGHKTEITEM